MLNKLKPSVRSCIHDENIFKRYLRPADASKIFGIDEKLIIQLASAAGAIHQLPRILLIHHQRLEEYMKHLNKVPGVNKTIQKKYVRIGEGSIIYSIGRHRFIEMARAAGAVYKINEGTGGTVLINLEQFDVFMEQFRENLIPMKNPLWRKSEEQEGG